MKNLISSLLFIITVFTVSAAGAYTHTRELPSDFHPGKCEYDNELIKYKTWFINGKIKLSTSAQIVEFSHKSIVNNNQYRVLPDGPKFAYNYFCSYKNSRGLINHIWSSYIHKDKYGMRMKTFVVVPSSYKKPLIYNGTTYSNWIDWYNNTFFDDEEVDSKYKNVNSLEYFAQETIPIHDKTMNLMGYKNIPLYKYRYVGSFKKGSQKYHTWETFIGSNYSSKAFIYTINPYPPKFEDRINWVELSKKFY